MRIAERTAARGDGLPEESFCTDEVAAELERQCEAAHGFDGERVCFTESETHDFECATLKRFRLIVRSLCVEHETEPAHDGRRTHCTIAERRAIDLERLAVQWHGLLVSRA